MRRLLVHAQLWLFGRSYCASPYETLHLNDLEGVGIPVPWKSWAEVSAARRERRTGQAWHVTKWGRKKTPVPHRSLTEGRGGRQTRRPRLADERPRSVGLELELGPAAGRPTHLSHSHGGDHHR